MREYTLTVTSKGQVTLPASYRKLAGIETGAHLKFVVDEAGDGHIRRSLTLKDIAGSLNHFAAGQPLSRKDIDAAVTEAMNEQEARVSRRKHR